MKYRMFRLIVLLGVAIMSHAGAPAAEPPTAGGRLHAIFEAEWEASMRDWPTWASRLGDLRYNDRWPDVSLEAIRARHRRAGEVLRRLDTIDLDALGPEDRISYRLFRREYELRVEGYPFRWYLLPLNQREGIQDADSLADALRFERVKDYQDWIARMRGLGTYMDQTIALLREGAAAGMVHPKVVMQRVPEQIRQQIVDDPSRSLWFKPFRKMPSSIEASEQERLLREAKTAIRETVVPAYRKLLEFFENDYLPACYDRVGIWQMPRGGELYAFRARKFTTTDLTPEEIHRIGLKEVRRIHGEMEKALRQVEWKGTFEQFLQHLRTDPKFYYDDPAALLEGYRATAKRIDPELVRLFRRLPRMPYGVEPIPPHLAPDTTTAYYRQPAADGSRAGTFFVNLYKPQTRPKYEMEVLTLHEAVPGHHLQIALAMELKDLPKFRRYGGYTSYTEGWALYCEGLGEDLGLYQDPYSKFGRLSYEMWRAIRLVVDTGIHQQRWPRQKAIDFFAANTAKSRHEIENEIDRYVSWPGQALAYKIGELKIKQLRARAEKTLGERFDVRAFHDLVLSNGAVTLDVLEELVEAWIAKVQGAKK